MTARRCCVTMRKFCYALERSDGIYDEAKDLLAKVQIEERF